MINLKVLKATFAKWSARLLFFFGILQKVMSRKEIILIQVR